MKLRLFLAWRHEAFKLWGAAMAAEARLRPFRASGQGGTDAFVLRRPADETAPDA